MNVFHWNEKEELIRRAVGLAEEAEWT